MKNIFDAKDVQYFTDRMEKLNTNTQPLWGKMNATQMLAHLNVSYEMIFEPGKHPAPKGMMKVLLKWLVKPKVTNEKPYKKSSPTAPSFIITDTRDFEKEKARLSTFMQQVQGLGAKHFEGKASLSFGVLNHQQWNNMLAKHLEHHFGQFGV
ncbi:hypothetical protein DBR32_05125 [Taibaiella sp. KBW10]|uniref:DUF1569 domain-containing protein n=1 Tax=Taibaiella sp. KBW10 TaxID=2153357 RepID=UPI000F5B34CA|nr:DUF1569 domain-containing protein [Taibaiella sp. KBW10]RQO31347.1 hypothetical protein DBR32_05125 [Taibaiella sp. KBW10]